MTTTSQTDFAESWRKYKRLRNTLIVLLPALLLIGPLENSAVHNFRVERAKAHFALEGAWVVAAFFTTKALRSWKCPQCGKSFYGGRRSEDKFSTYWAWWFLPEQCASCGLPRYSQLPLENGTSHAASVNANDRAPSSSQGSP
jgi:hypothetical protein